MTTLARPLTPVVVPSPPGRDAAMDLVRAASLVVVVALHAFMAGIAVVDGDIVVTNVVIGQGWFAPVSWIVQIMPLFFIVGGFAGITQWRRVRARGTSPASFVSARLRRLAVPAIAAFAVIGAGLGAALLAGVAPGLVGELGFRMAQPMWFLAVYLGATALVPLLARCHELAPRLTLGLLVAGVLAVDAVRLETGAEGLGFLNLAFVWLAIQQFGFWWADGRVSSLPRGRLAVGFVASTALLAVLTASGSYSADMFENLNPPTVCLVVLGAAQLFALGLAAPALRRLAARRPVATAVDVIGARSMTIYLWHMPALVLLAALLFAAGVGFPDPLSPQWWVTRASWIVGVAIVTALLVPLVHRFERRSSEVAATADGRRVAAGVVLGVAGVVVVLAAGFSPLTAAVAVAALGVGLRLTSGRARARATAPVTRG